jgi:GNAT superfamily N-acetyltransferase
MSDDITVRVADPSDLAAVDDLLSRSYPALLKHDYPPSVLVTVLPLISRANPVLLRSGSYFVAELEGGVVGAGGWTFRSPVGQHGGESLGHIRHVVTDHRRTRQGIGNAVMEAVFETARSSGATELEALSTRTAVPFYAALGFAKRGEVQVPLGPAGLPFAAERMLKRL